jgi:hydrogenase maturation factor
MPPPEPKIGKIDPETFSNFLLRRLGAEDDTVVVPPFTGVDAGVVELGDGKVLIVAEDPILAIPGQPLEIFGWYTVHIGASDVAVMGVKPRYMTYTLLLPPETSDADLETIVESIHEAALELGIAIVGGHTGRYPGLAAPLVGGVTVFAVAEEGGYVTPRGARPGDEVILTKGPAIEAAGILATVREKALLKSHPKDLVERAKALCKEMSVVKDAMVAVEAGGVTSMHDATEGGVIGGLFEVANASGVGMVVDEASFVYPEEVKMICDFFGIDPVAAIAEGSLIITAKAESSTGIIGRLHSAGIRASVVGTVTADPEERVMKRSDGRTVPLEIPEQDPFWPVFFESMTNPSG